MNTSFIRVNSTNIRITIKKTKNFGKFEPLARDPLAFVTTGITTNQSGP